VLCDAPQGRGGTWNAEGDIIFAPTAVGPLVRVAAAGGAPRPLAPSDTSRGQIAQRWPNFLPDGRHFLYWAPRSPRESGVFVGRADSPEVKALIPGASAAVFSNGLLLYVHGNVLLAQTFDPVRLELRSEARPIAEGVGWSADGGPGFSVSANGILAYRPAADPKTRLVWFDRQGKIIGEAGEPGVIEAFSLSPDGRQAVVARRETEDGPSALWVREFERGVNMRLTFGPLSNDSPIWSPDGSRILFSARRDSETGMFQVPANGSGKEELLLQTPGAVTLDSWSLDGRLVAYTAVDAKGGSAIWALPLEGGERKPMPILPDNFRFRDADFSPDVRWIAYVSNESGRDEVYVRGFPSGEGKWLISANGGTRPSWRRDGRELFYLSPEGMLMAVEIAPLASSIRPGVSRPLFQTAGTSDYAATADGKRFLMKAPVEDASPSGISVIMNWPQQLR
jgi:eukaryotic-like serine/threonine-protein kinase